MVNWKLHLCVLGLWGSAAVVTGVQAQEKISFNRDVRPILTANCFACHGPDEDSLEAELRLDKRDVAIDLEAIVPGQPEESSLVDRVFSTDPEVLMPPPRSDHRLSEHQKQILKRWIAEGATYEKHWAFQKPIASAPPEVKDVGWVRNSIDHFVLHPLELKGLQPNTEADRYTLVRRIYLDLIGLPPTIEQADAFVNSKDPLAFEKLVDQLLDSPRYGERWAQPWLDLARYSDTNGYEKDRERPIWPYRDWVIRSLNDDMPYNRFSIEQLAGDMLENPSVEQRIATGFHRNTMLNEEGGIDPLEYRYLAMVDRVSTTGTVWLGLTTGCAQCHTHKYDPITHTDYFRMMALLNNADEPDFSIPDPTRQAKIEAAKKRVKDLENALADKFPLGESNADDQNISETTRRQTHFEFEFNKWLNKKQAHVSNWSVVRPAKMTTNLAILELMDDGSIFTAGDATKRDVFELEFELRPGDEPIHSVRLEAIPDSRLPDGGPGKAYYEGRKGDFFVSEVDASLDGKKIEFASASTSFGPKKDGNSHEVFDGNGSTGWRPGNRRHTRLQLVMNLKEPIGNPGIFKIELLFERHYTASLGRFRISTSSNAAAIANQLDENVERIVATKQRKSWSQEERNRIQRAFLLETELLAEARKELDAARKRIPELKLTMVMQERPANNVRPTYRHHRGEWLSPKESVTPGIPGFLLEASDRNPQNRLEFAQWLVDSENPLAARVAVNRAWREFFGAGLMRTNGDFGVQAELPTHPELLDWLAVQFQGELNWSNKKLHRLIVTSATYRQSSEKSAAEIASDPGNRLLARGPGFRVSGETVRDIVLEATASLSTKMYGPGVRPPQPPAVTGLAYGKTKWNPSAGEDRFRRSVYTFRKRTAAFAAYTVFDGPTGEACTARRNRSNTPLQALTVLNDEMYVELARKFAGVIEADLIKVDKIRPEAPPLEVALTRIFRSFLTRPPTREELAELKGFYVRQLERFEDGQLSAEEIGGQEASHRQAALAMVARAVMNLDETVTKR